MPYTLSAGIMPSKFFSRLRTAASRPEQNSTAPTYSQPSPEMVTVSPPYEERDSHPSAGQQSRPVTLSRTVSESSYTPSELSQWNDEVDEAQESRSEELPPYEERPFLPNLAGYTQYSVAVSRARPRTSRPHSMCPCAQCHNSR